MMGETVHFFLYHVFNVCSKESFILTPLPVWMDAPDRFFIICAFGAVPTLLFLRADRLVRSHDTPSTATDDGGL
jgi:hypothetical protein